MKRTDLEKLSPLVCACTGPRPSNFPWDYGGVNYGAYRRELKDKMAELILSGVSCFISGMAMGVDMDIAETVLELKDDFDVSLMCAIPFPDQEKRFPYTGKMKYERILAAADKIVVVSDRYTPQCYFTRNRYMVDSSDMLFALWNGEQSGGTAYTIKYAMSRNKRIEMLDLRYIQNAETDF